MIIQSAGRDSDGDDTLIEATTKCLLENIGATEDTHLFLNTLIRAGMSTKTAEGVLRKVLMLPAAFYRDVRYTGSVDVQREYNGVNEFSGGGMGHPLFGQYVPPDNFDECVASGASCTYKADGPNGEMQCKYCGKGLPK